MPEYRTWITVAGLSFDDEAAWEPFISALEERHAELGPILSWENGGKDALAVLATDAPDEAEAARVCADAVVDALHAAGLGDRYPAALRVGDAVYA